MSPACHAREKRRRKRKYRNRARIAIGETQNLRSRTRQGGFKAKGKKTRRPASERAKGERAKGVCSRSRARKGACIEGKRSYCGQRG
jgi:hypothetical protein